VLCFETIGCWGNERYCLAYELGANGLSDKLKICCQLLITFEDIGTLNQSDLICDGCGIPSQSSMQIL
jgi:hypothetical protein